MTISGIGHIPLVELSGLSSSLIRAVADERNRGSFDSSQSMILQPRWGRSRVEFDQQIGNRHMFGAGTSATTLSYVRPAVCSNNGEGPEPHLI